MADNPRQNNEPMWKEAARAAEEASGAPSRAEVPETVRKDVRDIRDEALRAIGVLSQYTTDVLASDISSMIEREKWPQLDGYVLCLSKIMAHQKAWPAVERAFLDSGHNVPTEYYGLFSRSITSE